jgi:hypothetical protein
MLTIVKLLQQKAVVMNYPILMADIVDSGIKQPNLLIKEFKDSVSMLNNKYMLQILSPLTITLGDEFQGVFDKLDTAVKVIFDMEELIIKNNYDYKLRYVLNYGIIQTPINSNIAYEMLGEGLTVARSILNEKKKDNTRFTFNYNKNKNQDIINDAFSIYQSFIDDWKSKDITAVSEFLKYDNYRIVSEIINTDPSSAWRRKKSLKINEYNGIKKIIIHLINELHD